MGNDEQTSKEVETAHSIDLELAKNLRDPEFRKQFFIAEASADIARQLIALRKRRGLNQKELAVLVDTGQPAISRAESADYQNWSLSTLRKIAQALDARIRVLIQPSEDVLAEYQPTHEEIVSAPKLSGNRDAAPTVSSREALPLFPPVPEQPQPFFEASRQPLRGDALRRGLPGPLSWNRAVAPQQDKLPSLFGVRNR